MNIKRLNPCVNCQHLIGSCSKHKTAATFEQTSENCDHQLELYKNSACADFKQTSCINPTQGIACFATLTEQYKNR